MVSMYCENGEWECGLGYAKVTIRKEVPKHVYSTHCMCTNAKLMLTVTQLQKGDHFDWHMSAQYNTRILIEHE